MVSETTFEEKIKELEEWITNHNSLPVKIGKNCFASNI